MPQKNWTRIILLTIVLIGAVTAIIFWWGKTRPNHESAVLPSSGAATSSAPSSVGLGTSTLKTYRNAGYGFTLEYPSDFNIETRSSIDSRYEVDLYFTKDTAAVPLTLQVTDLSKYLPLTNTPKLSEYIQTFGSLEGYREATINDKPTYEFLICGRAACSQEVVFVHNDKQYQFSIEYVAYFQNGEISGDMNPRSITLESAPLYVQEIIKSVGFRP